MMAHKQLHELLKEDQQPFHLKTYISERRCHLKPPNSSSKTTKQNLITNNFCKHACFLPLQESQNGVGLLPVPALLLEAAMRVQKKQGCPKNIVQIKNSAFGLLGSALKKLRDRKNNKRRELGDSRSYQNGKTEEQKTSHKTSFSCTCKNHSNSISTSLSPFAPQTSTSSGHHSPEFSSPASSPVCSNKENPKSAEGSSNEAGDEESEQCSPVSILDTPFEDEHVEGHEDEFEGDSYDDDLECSFAIVQEAKEQLLDKLRRFEKLAGLDPVELEKRMMEQMEEEGESDEEDNDDEPMPLGRDDDLDTMMMIEALSRSRFKHSQKLVSDLIKEEDAKKYGGFNKEVMIRRVSRRLTSWKEVEPNEIDSMAKLEFERDFDGSNNNVEDHGKIVKEIEVALFVVLMEEVIEELTS